MYLAVYLGMTLHTYRVFYRFEDESDRETRILVTFAEHVDAAVDRAVKTIRQTHQREAHIYGAKRESIE